MRATLLLALPLSLALGSVPALGKTRAGAIRNYVHGIEIPAVANAPFRARVLVTWDQTLDNGSVVSRKYYTMVARDSQGRVHRETRSFIPADSSDDPPLRGLTIIDPVSATRTVCTEASMKCASAQFRPQLDLAAVSDGQAPASTSDITRQSLGNQTIEGLSVTGTRESPAGGAASQESSSVPYTDVWYSTDLHMPVEVIRNSPQLGRVTLRVTDLVRGEPDASWFAIPDGYRLKGGVIH